MGDPINKLDQLVSCLDCLDDPNQTIDYMRKRIPIHAGTPF